MVASPTYKASYTGLLKSFLDWFGTTDLDGVTVVPVMVGAGLQHALATAGNAGPRSAMPGPVRPHPMRSGRLVVNRISDWAIVQTGDVR